MEGVSLVVTDEKVETHTQKPINGLIAVNEMIEKNRNCRNKTAMNKTVTQ